MHRSTDRILVSHAGVLPRPQVLSDAWQRADDAEFDRLVPAAVADAVRRQAEAGVDVVNDGEMSKGGGFSNYVRDRLSGIEERNETPEARNITARDKMDFPGFFDALNAGRRVMGPPPTGPQLRPRFANQPQFCTSPVQYVGHKAVETDVANLRKALEGVNVTDAYLPAIAPGTIEHWLWNEHYPDDESFLFAIAEAMNQEYKAITDAGFILQIDDPDLPDGWQIFPTMSVADYRTYAELRVEAINVALKGVPAERVRLHVCWGSGHGPHKNDIPLADIIDIILKVKAEQLSIEACNPRHEHDYHVWEKVKLPDGMTLMPGVVGHATDIIEHPELVAERLERYANLVGKENVVAGTDCGLGTRVGHAEIAWAKLQALAEGAAIASKRLWRR